MQSLLAHPAPTVNEQQPLMRRSLSALLRVLPWRRAAVNGTAAAPMVNAFAGAANVLTPQVTQTLMEGLMTGADRSASGAWRA